MNPQVFFVCEREMVRERGKSGGGRKRGDNIQLTCRMEVMEELQTYRYERRRLETFQV